MISKNEYQILTSLKPVTIKGNYNNKSVLLNGKDLYPDESLKVFIHSKDGFNWGNAEDGAAQLALSVLLEITKNKKLSMILHHAFKNDFLANLEKKDFEKEINIGAWIYNNINKNYIL